MTDINWTQLGADREAGTPGPWRAGNRYTKSSVYGANEKLVANTHGHTRNYDIESLIAENDANRDRIARLPALEAYALAAREKLEAADRLAEAMGKRREMICELAEYILNRDQPGLTEYEAKGIFGDLQRARLGMDTALAAYRAAGEGEE